MDDQMLENMIRAYEQLKHACQLYEARFRSTTSKDERNHVTKQFGKVADINDELLKLIQKYIDILDDNT
jgi:hypothetical protein